MIIESSFLSKIVDFVLPIQRKIRPAVIKKASNRYSMSFLLNLSKSSASMNPMNPAPPQKAAARIQ